MGRILMTTQDEIAGLEITHTLGLVDGMGSTIHWQHRANEPFLEQILKEARDEAVERMLEKADMRDADAVVGLRFTSSGLFNHTTGAQAFIIHAYGTAVITSLRV